MTFRITVYKSKTLAEWSTSVLSTHKKDCVWIH
ncbi:hypothetical protein [Caudoviricetes sp.]|nr:hypothetical protein [Caudoviricetes sp.]